MAGNSCSLTCNIKDPKDPNKVKVSALWEDLAKFFKEDRRQAVIHYFLTKDSNFLRENSDILEFDTDGEVTLQSLKKALDRDGEYSTISNDKVLLHLNQEIQEEIKGRNKVGNFVGYSEALDAVLKFNRSNQFREGYMATLKKDANGKYTVEVVHRDDNAEYALADHVHNKILTDAIRTLLKNKGLSVEFLDNPSYAVQFNTQTAHLDADGLYAVASILDGINTSNEAAETAGHFIVASMQNSPLIQRLVDMLSTDVQKAIFRNDKSELNRDDFIVAETSAMEAAGILIGRSLLKPFKDAQRTKTAIIGNFAAKTIKNWGGIRWLLSKITDFAYKVFGKEKPEDIRKLVQKAWDAASTAANGYIADQEESDTKAALATSASYSAGSLTKNMAKSVRRNIVAFNDTLGSLKDIVANLRDSVGRADNATNMDIYKNLTKLVETVATKKADMNFEAFAQKSSIEGMIVALEGITYVLDHNIRDLLEQIQPSNRTSSYYSITANARNMRTVNTAIQGIGALYEALNSKLDTLSSNETINYLDADKNRISENLKEAVKKLGDVLVGNVESYTDITGQNTELHGLRELMEAKRRQIFIDAIREFYGDNFVDMAAGMVWEQRGLIKVLVPKNQRAEVKNFIESLNSDITWFDRFFSSAADCGDFVTAVGNKQTKLANMYADRVASIFYDRIEESRMQMAEVFGTTDWTPLLETIDVFDDDGNKIGTSKTGNFVQELNYGAWEKDRDEFKRQLKLDWFEFLAKDKKKGYANNKNVKGYVYSLTDLQKAALYHKFSDPLWQKWHEEHSDVVKTAFGKKYVPKATKYHNMQWDNLFGTKNLFLSSEEVADRKRKLQWYNAFMQIKEDMDAFLPKNATVTWRAPQMTGRFSHRYRNLKTRMGNTPAFWKAMRREVGDWYTIRPDEAWKFGSNNEFNTIEEDPLEDEMYFQREKINRLPLFGINKLKNRDDLSTDIFGTMVQYGSMAATYNAMEQVVDVFELGRDVLKQRQFKDSGSKFEIFRKKGESRAYARYLKFLEKQVYGLNVTPPDTKLDTLFRKLINKLSSLGGRILLGGNVHGGIVNVGTGFLEMYKEALAGENYTSDEFWKAHQMYFNGLLSFDSESIYGTMLNGVLNTQRPEDKNSLWIRHWNI